MGGTEEKELEVEAKDWGSKSISRRAQSSPSTLSNLPCSGLVGFRTQGRGKMGDGSGGLLPGSRTVNVSSHTSTKPRLARVEWVSGLREEWMYPELQGRDEIEVEVEEPKHRRSDIKDLM